MKIQQGIITPKTSKREYKGVLDGFREIIINKVDVYKGKRYSLPTKHIGKKVSVKETGEGQLNIYYNDDIVGCQTISHKNLHYKHDHIHQILKSDACKTMADDKIDHFIKTNLSTMDIYLGE